MERLVKYDTAILAEKLGFNETCNTVYINKNKPAIHFPMRSELGFTDIKDFEQCGLHNSTNHQLDPEFKCEVSAPSQTELQTWLRKNKKTHISITYSHATKYIVEVYSLEEPDIRLMREINFDEYEDALEYGLFEIIRMFLDIKTK